MLPFVTMHDCSGWGAYHQQKNSYSTIPQQNISPLFKFPLLQYQCLHIFILDKSIWRDGIKSPIDTQVWHFQLLGDQLETQPRADDCYHSSVSLIDGKSWYYKVQQSYLGYLSVSKAPAEEQLQQIIRLPSGSDTYTHTHTHNPHTSRTSWKSQNEKKIDVCPDLILSSCMECSTVMIEQGVVGTKTI